MTKLNNSYPSSRLLLTLMLGFALLVPMVADAASIKSKDDDLIIDTSDGFSVATANGEHAFRVNARTLLDFNYYDGALNRSDRKTRLGKEEVNSESSFDSRDTRITLSGHTNYNWHFKFAYQFDDGGSFPYAYVRYSGFGDWANLTVGKQKTPFALDFQIQRPDLITLERNILSQAFSTGYQYGIALSGHNNRFSYKIGTYSLDEDEQGSTIATRSPNSDPDFNSLNVARFTVLPVETRHGSFHLGWAYQKLNLKGGSAIDNDVSVMIRETVAGVTTTSTTSVARFSDDLASVNTEIFGADTLSYGPVAFDAIRDLSMEIASAVGPVYMQFELIERKFEGVSNNFSAAQAVAAGFNNDDKVFGASASVAWAITGQRRQYNAAEAIYDLPNPESKLGIWELYFRFSNLDLSRDAQGLNLAAAGTVDDVAHDYSSASVGFNWYINKDMRLNVAYTNVSIDQLTTPAIPSSNELALPLGQDTLLATTDEDNDSGDAFSVRFQYSF